MERRYERGDLDYFLPPLGKVKIYDGNERSKTTTTIIIIIASIKLSHVGKKNIVISEESSLFTVQLKRTRVNNHANFVRKEKKLRLFSFYTLCLYRREK